MLALTTLLICLHHCPTLPVTFPPVLPASTQRIPDHTPDTTLQVIQCVLRDFDVVYAPLISSYGSATATLEASPGTEVSMFITYLTPPLQQRMHETEGAYNLVELQDIQLLEGVSLQQHRCGLCLFLCVCVC